MRTPPQSQESEQALLGALLLDASAFSRVADLLDDKSFYRPAHALVYTAMHELDAHHEPIDLITVTEQLRRMGKLEEIGGPVFLTELAEVVPSAANVEHYARMVHEKAMLRRMISVSNEAAMQAYDSAARADSVFETLQKKLVELLRERRGRHAMKVDDVLHDTMEYISQMKLSREYVTGVPSGFRKLDDLTTGFNAGELVIVAARPSMGKTSLAMNMAVAAAEHKNTPVAVFSLEMETRQLLLRMLSGEANIFLQKLRTTAKLRDEEWTRLVAAAGRLAQLPMYFDDTAGLGIESLRTRARQLWMDHKIGLVVIDYLQLIQPPKMADNQQQWVAFVSSSLKALAKELSIPVICLSQLSRAPETRGGDRKPMLSDLRDSGAIEQDADMVMFIYRPWVYRDQTKVKKYEIANVQYDITEHLAEVIVAKNRNGPTGSVPMSFIGEYTKFADMTGETPPPVAEGEEAYSEPEEEGAGF
ncbi:MAG TPA: replicative DNA helicase [bacterium]